MQVEEVHMFWKIQRAANYNSRVGILGSRASFGLL